jgi:hypothetical protein
MTRVTGRRGSGNDEGRGNESMIKIDEADLSTHAPDRSRRGQRSGVAGATASLIALVVALCLPAPALAAPQLTVTLQGQYSEVQMVMVRGTGGQFRLRFGDGGPGVAETTDLPYNPTAAQIQNALNALSNVSDGGGSVSVAGSGATTQDTRYYRVTFDGGPFAATDVPLLQPAEGTVPLTSPHPDKVTVDTIEPAGLSRADRRVDYHVSVSNNALPVAGNPGVGTTLGCLGAKPAKGWTPSIVANRPSAFEFEWLRNGETIAGETAASYVTTAADAGAQIQCLVYAWNSNGTARSVLASLSPASPAAMVVDPQPSPAPPAPTSVTVAAARPAVTGTGAVNDVSTRTCAAPANWAVPGGGAIAYEFQWLRNGTAIVGATTATHTIVAADQGTVLQCRVTGRSGTTGVAPDGGKLVGISTPAAIGAVTNLPTLTPTNGNPELVIDAVAPVIELEVPAGQQSYVTFSQTTPAGTSAANDFWSCSTEPAVGLQPAKVTCANPNVLAPQAATSTIQHGIALGADAPNPSEVVATATAPGAPIVTAVDQFEFNGSGAPFGLTAGTLVTALLDSTYDLQHEYTQAGGHPAAATARVSINAHRRLEANQLYGRMGANAGIKQLLTDTPAGLVGNPLAVTELCDDPAKLLSSTDPCPAGSIVGEARYKAYGFGTSEGLSWNRKPLVAIRAERGEVAQFAFADSAIRGIYVINARLDPERGYSISLDTAPISGKLSFIGLGASVCSHGAGANGPELGTASATGCKQPGDAGAFEKPFLTAPTACGDELVTRMTADSWENPGVFSSLEVVEPAITGCELVPFTPTTMVTPTSQVADSPSGLEASISIPNDGLLDPDGISQAHLKKTVVELPAGVSVNPSAATGLEGCSDERLGLKTDSEPACPDGSKLGTVTATTPVLEETLTGVMVLRTPSSTDPLSGGMLRMALIVRNDERGILVKLPGSATADPQTGRLVATFDDNPQLPIGTVDVELKGGDRGVLAMGQDCGPVSTRASLTPWSGNADAVSETPLAVNQRCGNGFAPAMAAGNSDNTARGTGGSYSFKFSRQDGEEWLRGLTAKLPKGLLASVKDVPLCSNGLANAGNCPPASKIGIVDAKAGSGDPFVLEEKGEVFLTEGYKGGEYGLAVKIRPVAGPFRGQYELSPIVVRQAIHVDRTTAEVTAISDPFPLIHHGIPLRAREVSVLVNRGGFMVNPSDCTQKQSSATLLSNEGATASLSSPFQVTGCAGLAFRPKLALSLTGRKQVRTGNHPGIKAAVTQRGTSEAGIEKAVVRLPKSLALDPNNAQALCEFADGTRPDLENHCPKGSIVGRARAKTPLLKDDLVGNVYFVKNVRKDPKTGNEIRTLPMIVVALRGEIAINLKGESSTTKAGKLVNTFAAVPDAPISRFNLNIQGGKTGIIAVTRTRKARINLCAGRHVAEVDNDGHNGRRYDSNVRMKTPCTKKQTKAAKRAARR